MGIILAIFVFSVLVIFHEMGHFLIAKKNGIGVTEFSIGMGPRLFSFVKGGTRYSLKLIMFGGSCAMVGNDMFEAEYQKDDEEEEESIEGIKDEREDSFNNKSVWARIAVIAAGPIFNFILAWVLAVVLIGLEGFTNTEITGIAKKGEVYIASFNQEMNLQGGEYLLSMSCTSFVDGELVAHDRMYDVLNITVVSDKNTVGFYDMNSEVSIEKVN